MSQVISFGGYYPSPRYDAIPWTEARIEESADSSIVSAYTEIDVITLTPVDADPAHPVVRNLTTELASDTMDLWYRIIFADATGDTLQPTTPVQNVAPPVRVFYAPTSELARILKLRSVTDAQNAAMERVLAAAAAEIDSEVGRATAFDAPYPALVVEVNLERAVEHWQQGEIPFGIVGLGDTGAIYTARDSWDRHAHKLSPLKETWGLA